MSDDDDDMGDGTGVLLSNDAPGIAQALKAASSNEEKLQSFLDDPNKSIRIFMSSYAWAKGYIWYILLSVFNHRFNNKNIGRRKTLGSYRVSSSTSSST